MPLIAVVTTLKESRSAVLVDISATGAKVQGSDLPAVAEEFFITIEGVLAFGTVAWANGSERGVAFDETLNTAEVARLQEGGQSERVFSTVHCGT